MTEIDTCSKSCADHSLPIPPRRSRKTFVAPYVKMMADSTNSPVTAREPSGFRFHDHPKFAQHPMYRPKTTRPYQKKMPPLMK
jgi:hypothetical protein